MAPSCSRRALLLSVIFLLLFSTGFGRKMVDFSGTEHAVGVHKQGTQSRETMELDYAETGPNVNAKSGFLFSPPPPAPGLGY